MPRRKINYVNNPDLVEWTRQSQERGEIVPPLAKAILLIAGRMGSRGNFSNYSYVDEMKAEAIVMMCSAVPKIDLEKSSNVFAYLSRVSWNAFLRVLNKEARQHAIRDDLLRESGVPASGDLDR